MPGPRLEKTIIPTDGFLKHIFSVSWGQLLADIHTGAGFVHEHVFGVCPHLFEGESRVEMNTIRYAALILYFCIGSVASSSSSEISLTMMFDSSFFAP